MSERIKQSILIVSALLAALTTLAGGLLVWRLSSRVESLLAERDLASTAQLGTTSEALIRAERLFMRGDADGATRVLERAIQENELEPQQRLLAEILVARGHVQTGDLRAARAAIEAAQATADLPAHPSDLYDMGERAFRAGDLSGARRIYALVLGREDEHTDVRSICDRATMRIGDTYFAEARGGSLPDPEEQAAWEPLLLGVDENATPRVLREGEHLSVEARRIDARRLLEAIARAMGKELVLSPAAAAMLPAAVSLRIRKRPADQVLWIVAHAAGLLVEAGGSLERELRVRTEAEEPRPDPRDLAVESYLRALERQGTNASRAQFQIAEIERENEEHASAVDRYRALVRSWPQARIVPQALLGLARSEAALLRLVNARDALHRLLELDSPEAKELAPIAFRLLADCFLAEGSELEAQKVLRHLLDRFPDFDQADATRLKLAQVQVGLGRIEEALQLFREGLDKGGSADQLRATLGAVRSLLDLKRPGEALPLIRKRLRTVEGVDRGRLYVLLAKAHDAAKDPVATRFALEHLARVYPERADEPGMILLAARTSLALGLLAETERTLERLGPSGSALQIALELADLQLREGQLGQARRVLTPFAQPPHPVPEALIRLARLDLRGGDPRACLEALERLPAGTLTAERVRLASQAELVLGRAPRTVARLRSLAPPSSQSAAQGAQPAPPASEPAHHEEEHP